MASMKSWGRLERSHWFQELSLSTSSREDGMSKSPAEDIRKKYFNEIKKQHYSNPTATVEMVILIL